MIALYVKQTLADLLCSPADRKYGWAPLGEMPGTMLELKRSERWSILPALTVKGYIDWTIVQGFITKSLYLDFVRDRVLPHCNPYGSGKERSVLVMDNASIHKTPEMRELCERAGVRVEYLPPYSPDFNPIETSFAILKAWIRRKSDDATLWASSGMFREFLNNAMKAQIGAYDAGLLFRKADIRYGDHGSCWGEVDESDVEPDVRAGPN